MSAGTGTQGTTRRGELVLAQLEGLPMPGPKVRDAFALAGEFLRDHEALTRGVVGELSLATCEDAVRAGLDREHFWRHCLAAACAARRIAALCTEQDEVADANRLTPDEAFLFGLLHDIGKIALDAALPKSYARVLRRCREGGVEISEAERDVLGVDHTAAGRHLGERWGMPARLLECIWLHHHPPEALPETVSRGWHVQIVQLADAVAREQGIGFSGTGRAVSSFEPAAGLGLSRAQLTEVGAALAGDVEQRAAWIGSARPQGGDAVLRGMREARASLSGENAELMEENRRLWRRAAYLEVIDTLHFRCAPGMAVREVCAAGAEALRGVLSIEGEVAGDVAVFVVSEDGRWADIGTSRGGGSGQLVERPADAGDAAVEIGFGGAGLMPVGAGLEWVVDRVRDELGLGPVWLVPIVWRERFVGGGLVVMSAERVASLRGESAQLGVLLQAIGLAIVQAQAQAAARGLADELTAVNRRLAELGPELARGRALETVAAMAGGAAHELNNPLAVISGRAQLLAGQTENEEFRRELRTLASQAQACSDIVTELMEFASPSPLEPEAVDVAELITSLGDELAGAGLLDASQMAVEVAPGCPAAWFDRGRFSAILRELFDNALAAMEGARGRLTVKVETDLTEESVVVLVADNGCGMTPEVLGRAFDPFYSHRPAGRRRGLGLSKVQRWLQMGGGRIRLESEAGAGTRVEVRLPAMR